MNERAVSPARSPRAHVLLGGLAFVFLLLEWVPGFAGEAGYFIDELYYLACAQRPDFGYVDHPPLSVWLLGAVRAVLGDSLAALHLGPALAGAATVLVVGDTARRLGAGRFGQGVAAVGVMAAPIYQILFGFWSMNAFSMLIWAAALRILVEIERNGRTGLWVAFGLVMGLGIENKHTIMLLALGLAAGFLLTPARRHLAGRGPWMALGIAALLALPNLAWQAAYGWPSLEFYRNADLYKNLPTPPLAVLGQQVLMLNPLSLPIWLAGLAFLLGTRAGRPWRHLGLAFVVLLVVMVAGGKSRPDRIAGAYTILFAAGGVLLETWTRRAGGQALRSALIVLPLIGGAALAPIALTILPTGVTARYAQVLGVVPQIERGAQKQSRLPQWLADRYGWEDLVADVEAAVASLDPAERPRAIIFGSGYGQAASLEQLGHDLPPVYSTHNSYYLWGPPEEPVDVVIVVGMGRRGSDGKPVPEEALTELFAEIELLRVHDCRWCMPWRDGMPIWLAREPRRSLADAWRPYYR